MTKLEKLYTAIKNLEDIGYPISPEMLLEADRLEEMIIKDEILPAIGKDIEPRLQQIQRPLVLVVDYNPDESIRVSLSRKKNISEIIDAKTLTQQKDTAEGPKYTKETSVGFSVTFPDGTIFNEKKAVDTFIKTLKKIGLKRIADDENCPRHSQYKVVDTHIRTDQPKTQRYVDGYYIFIKTSNNDKIADLDKISKRFGLNLYITSFDE